MLATHGIYFVGLEEWQKEIMTDPDITHSEAQKLAKLQMLHLATFGRWCKRLGLKKRKHEHTGSIRKERIKTLCAACGMELLLLPKSISSNNYCSHECMFSEGSPHREMLMNIDRSYMQTEAYSKAKSNPNTPEYKKYYRRVRKLSEKTYETYRWVINSKGLPRGLAGIEGAYHLDHIISVKEGWNMGLPAEYMADVSNLQMLSWEDNLAKRQFDPILKKGK